MSNKNGVGEKSSTLFNIVLYIFIFLCPVFFLKNWDLNMIQGIFFTFGTFALLGISCFCKKEREYDNKYLGLIVLWSLINVFIHTFSFALTKTYASSFLNYCLLSEGFIYILCGALLFYLIVSYSKDFKVVYPILAINMLNLAFVVLQKLGIRLIWTRIDGICGILGMAPHMVIISAISIPIIYHFRKWLVVIPISNMIIGHYGWGHSFSGVFALFMAVVVYLIIRKRFKILSAWILSGLIFIGFSWHFFISKAIIRFGLWGYSIKEIISSPIFGKGFDNSLNNNMINIGQGWMYRHNDYLNISRDLGLPFLAFILIPLFLLFKKTKFDYLSIAILVILISCMTWTGMYFARIASIAIVLLALKECEYAS